MSRNQAFIRCASCGYWDEDEATEYQLASTDAKPRVAKCRRNAPQMVVYYNEQSRSIVIEGYQPETRWDDGCGEGTPC